MKHEILSLITALSVVFISNTAVAKPIISLACNDINIVSYPMATGGKSINGFGQTVCRGALFSTPRKFSRDIVGSVVFKDATGRVIDKEAKGSKVLIDRSGPHLVRYVTMVIMSFTRVIKEPFVCELPLHEPGYVRILMLYSEVQ